MNRAPLFLLGAPFSGLSYLAGELGGHAQLFALPELNLFMGETLGDLLDIAELDQGAHLDGLLRAVAQIEFGEQSDEGVTRAREWLHAQRAWSGGALLKHFVQAVAPRRLVLPDAGSSMRPMDLRRLHAQCPDAALLHALRHPWTQGCLLAGWARERLFVPPDYKDHGRSPAPPVVDAQVPWLRANLNVERLCALPGVNARRARLEDVDDQPAALAGFLGEWLGLDAGPAAQAALTRPQQWLFAGYGPRSAPYGLEPDALEALPEADVQLALAPRLDAPLPWRADGQGFAPETRAMAARYGYA